MDPAEPPPAAQVPVVPAPATEKRLPDYEPPAASVQRIVKVVLSYMYIVYTCNIECSSF